MEKSGESDRGRGGRGEEMCDEFVEKKMGENWLRKAERKEEEMCDGPEEKMQ